MLPRTKGAARLLALIGLLLAFMGPGAAAAALVPGERPADTGGAAAMRTRYEAIRPQLEQNQFGRPLYLVSQEGNRDLNGDAYGIVEHPFERVSAALADAANWCQVLILPFNTKYCAVEKGTALTLYVGKKNYEPIERAYRLDFTFHPVARTPDYLRRVLKSESGPLGTRNYVITLEATPLDARRTLIHLSYSYSYGTISKLAMQTYLATVGASRVGFSVTEEGGTRRFVGGMRGVMERNTMRYFLAIEAFLAAVDVPDEKRRAARAERWYAAVDKYPRQLREMSRAEYLALKAQQAG